MVIQVREGERGRELSDDVRTRKKYRAQNGTRGVGAAFWFTLIEYLRDTAKFSLFKNCC